jgi:hypothetical protein
MGRTGAWLSAAVLGSTVLGLAGCSVTGTAAGRATAPQRTSPGPGGTVAATGTGPGSVAAGQPERAGSWAVRGTFELEGGVAMPATSGTMPARPLSGVVMLRAASGRTTDLTAGPAGQFAGYLPAGTYTVTARTEQIRQQNPDGSVSDPPCAQPVTVVVRPGEVTKVALFCYEP